jgi:hypothetical protein
VQSPICTSTDKFAQILLQQSTKSVHERYSVAKIVSSINFIADYFSVKAIMYATQLCLVQVNESVVSFCSEKTERHATGKVLPHTTEEFSSNEQNMLSTFDPHNHSQKDVHSLKAICFNEKEPKGQGGKRRQKRALPFPCLSCSGCGTNSSSHGWSCIGCCYVMLCWTWYLYAQEGLSIYPTPHLGAAT